MSLIQALSPGPLDIIGDIHGEYYALQALLTQLGYRAAFVAIELNGNIIKQADFGSTTITDADKLEIVSFVGGG